MPSYHDADEMADEEMADIFVGMEVSWPGRQTCLSGLENSPRARLSPTVYLDPGRERCLLRQP